MKKLFVAAAATLTLASCGMVGDGLNGVLYKNVTLPQFVEGHNNVGNKVGTSSATNILNLLATGDAGINAAAKSAGIKKISHVDQNTTTILGLFTTRKTMVYGE